MSAAEDARLVEALAEVEHWKSHAKEAGAGFARVCRDAARYTARNTQLARERDMVYAKLTAVAALLDEFAMPEHQVICRTDPRFRFRWPNASCTCFVGHLRALLADHIEAAS